MAFPATALPVRQEFFIGGSWVNVTTKSLVRDPIRIRRGISNGGVRADPSSCRSSLKNKDGQLSPRLPTSPYYGLIGRNTPMRVVLDVASDDFNRTSSNGWGTSSSGQAWATSGGLASAYAVSAGVATIAISATNSARVTALNISEADVDVVFTFKPGVVATGAAIQMSAALRYQDDNNMWMPTLIFNTDSTVTLAIVVRKAGVNTTLSTASVGTYTATSQYRLRAKVCGPYMTVRAWDAVSDTEPATFQDWAADTASDAILAAGKIGTRMLLQSGNTNTLPITVSASNLDVVHHRYDGEIPVWPVAWDLSGNDVWTSIEAAGILRRIYKSREAFSPLRRALKIKQSVSTGLSGLSTPFFQRPNAYWPLEEESGSTIASSGLPDGQPMTISGTVDWALISTVDGSDPLPDMMNGDAILSGAVPPTTDTMGAWTVGAVFTRPTLSSTWTALSINVGGGAAFDRLELRLRTDDTFDLYGFVGSTSTLLGNGGFRDLASRTAFVCVGVETFGTDILYRVKTTDATYTTHYTTISYNSGATVVGFPTQVTANSVAGGASDTAGLGHLGVWQGEFILVGDNLGDSIIGAIQAHAGEQGHARLFRLFAEEELPFIFIGNSSDAMGKQRSASLPDLIDDVLVVDKGLFYEARDENAAVYWTRRSRYNRPATLALTYGASGHVAPPFQPVEDDRDVINDLTVVREGGASGRYEQRTGALSVNAPPSGMGRYSFKKTLSLYTDTQSYQHAAWEVNEATWDEARYQAVNLNMSRLARSASAVYEQARRLDIGGRLTVASPPAWLPPDTIDLHALGLAEVIGAFAWSISAATVPAGPYIIGTLDNTARDKAQTAGCELMVNRNSTDTAFTVHTTTPPKWVTGAGLSIPLIAAGERMTATAISNVTPSFVAAGTASHGVNASLTPALPAGLAAGDLLLVFAAIRNSGTGFPNAPGSDWDLLLDMSNARIYGKYAQTGESAPTVTFAAGATDQDTSAQTAAFRGIGLTVHKRATQLNASATNIAYPALAVGRANCLVIQAAWKADDWTSVDPVAGFTEIGEPDTTTGFDQGIVWGYVLQSTATNIPAGSFVVNGTISQISRAGVLALGSDVQTMTVTRSVNTVAKSQTTRTAISVYQSARAGL